MGFGEPYPGNGPEPIVIDTVSFTHPAPEPFKLGLACSRRRSPQASTGYLIGLLIGLLDESRPTR